MSKLIVAVAGATGQQGGAVARSLLRHGHFAVRALTRNVDSDKAKALKTAGAEVVRADLDDDMPSLQKALHGAHGAFLVTNFWAHMDAEREFKQGTKFIDAAKKAGVQHLVFSGLENVEKDTQGRLKCPHFTAKGRVEEYLASAELPKYSIVRLAAYADTFVSMAQKQDDGSFVLTAPMGDKKMHFIAVEDLGDVVHTLLDKADEYNGKTAGIAGDFITLEEAADRMSQASGKAVRYRAVSMADYRKFPFPGADDMADMFQYYLDIGEKLRDVALTKKLNPAAQNFDEFLTNNKDKLEKALS